MENWVPLFEIFLSSPTPETDASRWLQESFCDSAKAPASTSSFLSLLGKPQDAVVLNPLTQRSRVLFIETLPPFVQSRILSFLAYEHQRFDRDELSNLGNGILSGHGKTDFWVERAARHLLDITMSVRKFEQISWTRCGSEEVGLYDEFDSVPVWLKNASSSKSVLLPCLSMPLDALTSDESFGCCGDVEMSSQVSADEKQVEIEDANDIEVEIPEKSSLGHEILDTVAGLKDRLVSCNSASRSIELSKEIRELCLRKDLDPFQVLELLEPWKADDEAASVLISHLTDGTEDELAWPSQVLCGIILPKLLVLENPVARVLLAATLDYCKHHQRATEYALLFPLTRRKEGINGPICDIISKIMKECLHPIHIAAFLQRLLFGCRNDQKFVCLPSQRCLISSELVWTELFFNLLQNLLNRNVHLTQDSVDEIVCAIHRLCERFSKSLKFGNFLLCLITKCPLALKLHKDSLVKVVEGTNTLVTKSILTKLASL